MKKFSLVGFLVALATAMFTVPAVAQTSAPAVEFYLNGAKLADQPSAGKKNFSAVATDTVAVKAMGSGAHNLICTVNAVPVNCSSIKLDAVGTLATVEARLAMNQATSIPQSRTFTVPDGKEPAQLRVVAAESAKLAELEKRLKEANLPDLAKDVAGLKVALNNHRTNVLAAAAARKKFEQVLNDRLTAIEEQQKRHGIAIEAAATTANQAVNVATDAKTSADIARTNASMADLAATRANARLDLLLPPTSADSHPGLVLGARSAFHNGLGVTVTGTVGGRIPVGNASGWWIAFQVGVGAGEKPAQGFGSLVLQTEAGFEYYPLRLIGFGGGVTHSSWFAGPSAHGVGGVGKLFIQPHPNFRLVAEGGVINLVSAPAVLDAPRNSPFVGGGLQFTW